MSSTERWLAKTLEERSATIAAGLASWLKADESLAHVRALAPGELRRLGRSVVQELVSWLRKKTPDAIVFARAKLNGAWTPGGGDANPMNRASNLAFTCICEDLQGAGLLDANPLRAEVRRLLEEFFVDRLPGRELPRLPRVQDTIELPEATAAGGWGDPDDA